MVCPQQGHASVPLQNPQPCPNEGIPLAFIGQPPAALNCHQSAGGAMYRTDPIKAWKAMRTLEKGLLYHHSKCHAVCIRKPDGTKAAMDEENAK
eukprot:4285349-Ditylum_brightwellii.AAC.1